MRKTLSFSTFLFAIAILASAQSAHAQDTSTDLDITIQGPDALHVHQEGAYTVRLYNRGPGEASGVSFRIDKPSELIFAGSINNCTEDEFNALTCTDIDLDIGEEKIFEIPLYYLPEIGKCWSQFDRSVRAFISESPQGDPDTSRNESTQNIDLSCKPIDLGITGFSDDHFINSTAQLVFEVENYSTFDAPTATVLYTVPEDLTWTSNFSSNACSFNGEKVLCTIGPIGLSQIRSVGIGVDIPNDSSLCGTTVEHTAHVHYFASFDVPVSYDVNVVASGDVIIDPEHVSSLDMNSFHDINDENDKVVFNATIECPVTPICGNGVDDDGDGLVDGDDPGCSDPDDNDEQANFACDNGIDDDGDGLIDYRADGTGDAGCSEPRDQDEYEYNNSSSSSSSSSNSSSSSSVTPTENPNVTIRLLDSQDPVAPNDTFTYSVEVTNLESTTIVKDAVKLVLDNELTFVSASHNGSQVQTDFIQWNNISIASGTTVTLTAVVRVDTNVDENEMLQSIAFGSPTSAQLTRVAMNSGSSNSGNGDVNVSVTDDQDPVTVGEIITYTIRVRNDDNHSRYIDVRAFLDEETSFLSATDDGDEDDDDEVRWDNLLVSGNDTENLRLKVRVRNGARHGDTLRLRVRAEDDEDTERTEVSDRTRTRNPGRPGYVGNLPFNPNVPGQFPGQPQVHVPAIPLHVDIQANRRETQPGSVVQYSITVQNPTQQLLRNTEVIATVDPSTMRIENSANGTQRGSQIAWMLRELQPGQTVVLQYTTRVGDRVPHGQIALNRVELRSPHLQRLLGDAAEVAIIRYLPQTGTTQRGASFVQANALLRSPSSRSTSTSSDYTAFIVSIVTLMGLGAGGLLGKKYIM